MNFKRVLVLVLALIMAVSTFVTPVGAAFESETKHEHLEDVLNNPEYTEKYEEIKSMVEYIANDIKENHKEYYAEGYAYADEQGYIGAAIVAVEWMLETLPEVDLNGLGLTEELQAKLETELDALVPTLEKLQTILENEETSEFDGFVDAVLSLEGDLYLHMNNVYAILEQGSVDLNQLYLVPAFEEALRLINEEVIPAIENAVVSFVEGVVDYVAEILAPYYNAVAGVVGVAYDTYKLLVEAVVEMNLYVEGVIDTVVGAYNSLIASLLEVYGSVENAIEAAHDFYNGVVDAIVDLNTKVENTIADVQQFVVDVTNVYIYTVNLLVEIYGDVKNAVIVAGQVSEYLVDLWVENEEGLLSTTELAIQVSADIIEILVSAYKDRDDVYYTACRISAYIADVLKQIEDDINDKIDDAQVGNYELTDDSFYVSFGNAPYADDLAKKLNLSDKHVVETFGSNHIENLINADLVTVKLDNGSFIRFAEGQVEGKLAEIVGSNSDLMSWYGSIPTLISAINGWFWLSDEYKASLIDGLNTIKGEIDSYVDFSAQVTELDWDKYLDAEGKAALDSLLAKLRAEVIEQGVPEYYEIDINAIINDMLVENGLGGIFTLSFEPIVVPQADLVVFAVENMIYGYAQFVDNISYVLENASEDALIILTPVSNALYGYSFKGIDLGVYAESVDDVVDVLNAHLLGLAMANENVVFVNSEDANDIYDALEITCDHVLSSCTDTKCDRCGAKVPAMGHKYSEYVFNNNATCNKDGTETAMCERCGTPDTRTKKGSKTGLHDFTESTCTVVGKCKVCGTKNPDGLAPHVFGNWVTVKDPTTKSDGLRERKCTGKNCEERITEIIPHKDLSTIATVAIVISCVAALGGCSTFVAGILRRKKKD